MSSAVSGRQAPRWLLAGVTAAGLVMHAPVRAEMRAEELAKLAQNPVGNLISLPFQKNSNLTCTYLPLNTCQIAPDETSTGLEHICETEN